MANTKQRMESFYGEVLAHGPGAVLPQHLDDRWLAVVDKLAGEYLDRTYSLEQCRQPKADADPILTACVAAFLEHRNADVRGLTDEDLARKLTVYALWVITESVSRTSDFTYAKPSLDDVLSAAAFEAAVRVRPEFSETLEQACVLRYPGRNFWEMISDKLKSFLKD